MDAPRKPGNIHSSIIDGSVETSNVHQLGNRTNAKTRRNIAQKMVDLAGTQTQLRRGTKTADHHRKKTEHPP